MFSRIISLARTPLVTSIAVLILMTGSGLSTTALAHGYDDDDDGGYRRDTSAIAMRNGFRLGAQHGREDALRGLGFNFWHDEEYQEASWGYDRGCGSFYLYQSAFRNGYRNGYRIAYIRFRNVDRWGHGRRDDDDRDGRFEH